MCTCFDLRKRQSWSLWTLMRVERWIKSIEIFKCGLVCWLSDLRPFSWAFLPWSKSAASLKETRRPVVPVERKRSVSWSWELAIDRQSDSSTLMVISSRDTRGKRQRRQTDRIDRWVNQERDVMAKKDTRATYFSFIVTYLKQMWSDFLAMLATRLEGWSVGRLQTAFMVPRGWSLLAAIISWLFNKRHQQDKMSTHSAKYIMMDLPYC